MLECSETNTSVCFHKLKSSSHKRTELLWFAEHTGFSTSPDCISKSNGLVLLYFIYLIGFIYSDIYYLSSEMKEVDNKSQKKKGTNLGWDIWLEKEVKDLKDFFLWLDSPRGTRSLLWGFLLGSRCRSDRPVATHTRDRHPWPRRDSNPNPSKRAAVEPLIRPRDHRDRYLKDKLHVIIYICIYIYIYVYSYTVENRKICLNMNQVMRKEQYVRRFIRLTWFRLRILLL